MVTDEQMRLLMSLLKQGIPHRRVLVEGMPDRAGRIWAVGSRTHPSIFTSSSTCQ